MRSKRYNGAPCERCNTTLKIKHNNRCVECLSRYEKSPERIEAKRKFCLAYYDNPARKIKQAAYYAKIRQANGIKPKKGITTGKILEFLKLHPARTIELSKRLSITYAAADSAIRTLLEAGLVVRVAYGTYALTE